MRGTNAAVDILFGFTGRPYDEASDLQNNLNRWYDPVTGQWMSEDPIGFAAGDANLRRYVGNEVAKKRDPSGLYDEFKIKVFVGHNSSVQSYANSYAKNGKIGPMAGTALVAGISCQPQNANNITEDVNKTLANAGLLVPSDLPVLPRSVTRPKFFAPNPKLPAASELIKEQNTFEISGIVGPHGMTKPEGVVATGTPGVSIPITVPDWAPLTQDAQKSLNNLQRNYQILMRMLELRIHNHALNMAYRHAPQPIVVEFVFINDTSSHLVNIDNFIEDVYGKWHSEKLKNNGAKVASTVAGYNVLIERVDKYAYDTLRLTYVVHDKKHVSQRTTICTNDLPTIQ